MRRSDFQRLVDRDRACIHCGTTVGLVPHHRKNRGMGGSKLLDTPSNLLVVCSWLNGAMESDPDVARYARGFGWKLERWQDPAQEPIWDAIRGRWVLHSDDYRKSPHAGPGDRSEAREGA